MKTKIALQDSILSEITFEELITTVRCNEKTINEESIKRTFENILKTNLEDARFRLNVNLDIILKECKRG
jgi:hypothetical protein